MTKRWTLLAVLLVMVRAVHAQDVDEMDNDGVLNQEFQRQQQPARIACGIAAPKQQICDALSHPSSRRAMRVPIDSECVFDARSSMHFCGYANARCFTDSQCDFGRCSGERGKAGVCLGGLGDECESSEGPDDSLCMGNLGCSPGANGRPAVCGGTGSECLYTGSYIPGKVPNHLACISGVCDSATLTCAPVPEPPARQERLRVELTKAAAAAAKNIKKEKVKKPSVNKPLPAVQRQRQQQQQRQRAKPQFRVEAQLPQQPIAQYVPPSYDYAAANARLEDEEHDEELDEELDEDDEWNPEIATVTGLRQCPTGFTLCPVASRRPNSNGPDNSVDWACFDTTSSVTQCGGCSLPHPDVPDHLSNGEDCLQPSHDGDELASGVMSAACVESRCRVFSCGANFIFDRATGLCRPARRDGKR